MVRRERIRERDGYREGRGLGREMVREGRGLGREMVIGKGEG